MINDLKQKTSSRFGIMLNLFKNRCDQLNENTENLVGIVQHLADAIAGQGHGNGHNHNHEVGT
jgi:hypothetical protein